MKLREMLHRAVRPQLNVKLGKIDLTIPEDEDDDEDIPTDLVGDQSLSGLGLLIHYRDSKGKLSQRVISCRQYAVHAGKEYVSAYCHHRAALRSFRIDRIEDIFDPSTGESLSPVQAFFARFAPDKVTKSGYNWGLSVGQRADIIALLNALIFLARCDREFHPAERDSLESALTKFWLDYEIMGDPDFSDILAYADRLAPDGETFWIAMHRFREVPMLARLFQRQARNLIDADGVVHEREAYWAVEIDDFLSDD
ncbi:MAG: WYL domain-containing protein [Sphingomonadales bacterium]|nr:WYL domain-containing protein [Sphingomonadales bacterium]MBD3774682.1 WYL domain-containing protein [Paracoccaceae bacterium]